MLFIYLYASLFNRLWDHLALNVDLYVQHEESYMDEAPNQVEKIDSHHSDSESEREKSNKLSRSRHNREWKGLVRDAAEPPPLRSSDIDKMHYEEKPNRRVSRAKRSPSPRSFQRKRSQPDERENKKV